MRFLLAFLASLAEFSSTVDALRMTSNTFCVRANGRDVCPHDGPIDIDHNIRVQSGFAPYSVHDTMRRPKWEDSFEIPSEIGDVVFAPDYCFFTKTVEGVKWLGCAQTCYRGTEQPNPWFGRSAGDNQPDYRDPVSGQHNRYLAATPNTCPNPNTPLTSQSEDESGFQASNYVQPPAGDNTMGDTISINNELGYQEANALTPSTIDANLVPAPNSADLFPNIGLNSPNQYSYQSASIDSKVVGSGAGATNTNPSIDALFPGLSPLAMAPTEGTPGEQNTSPQALNLAPFGNLPLFRKRGAKSARDFRL